MEYGKFISGENQKVLRKRLFSCMKAKPLSFRQQAKDVGICTQTLQKFLDGGDVKFEPLCKIEAYVVAAKPELMYE